MRWLSIVGSITATMIGFYFGYQARVRSTTDRYLISITEKHEATARYWDTQTNNIITNNTLEAKRREKR